MRQDQGGDHQHWEPQWQHPPPPQNPWQPQGQWHPRATYPPAQQWQHDPPPQQSPFWPAAPQQWQGPSWLAQPPPQRAPPQLQQQWVGGPQLAPPGLWEPVRQSGHLQPHPPPGGGFPGQMPPGQFRQHGEAPGNDGPEQERSNVVPWRRPLPQLPPQSSAPDNRILLLFDLNGTLTTHTSKRRSAGVNKMRPGMHHLLRLQGLFRLGIFTSASDRTVASVIPMLHMAARQPVFTDRRLVLTRGKADRAPTHHIENGGNAWDTVKPLGKWFGEEVHRVVLVDDDSFKACPGEEDNMLLVPRWDDDDEDDDFLPRLVDAVLLMLGPLGDDEDVRPIVPQLTKLFSSEAQAGAGEGHSMAERAEEGAEPIETVLAAEDAPAVRPVPA